MSTDMFAAETVVKAGYRFSSSEDFRAQIMQWSPTSSKEELDAAIAAYKENAVTVPEQLNAAAQIQETAPEWETPAHKEVDPFDPEYDLIVNASNEPPTVEPGLIPFLNAAINKGFHVFPLLPNVKKPLPGSDGF